MAETELCPPDGTHSGRFTGDRSSASGRCTGDRSSVSGRCTGVPELRLRSTHGRRDRRDGALPSRRVVRKNAETELWPPDGWCGKIQRRSSALRELIAETELCPPDGWCGKIQRRSSAIPYWGNSHFSFPTSVLDVYIVRRNRSWNLFVKELPMRRRLVLAALAIVGGVMSTHAAEQPPNIVLLISDDQGWTDYGFMGHPEIRTPNLDQLAKQSVVFRRGYVPTALCRPSLTTLITGLYAHQSLVTGNDPANTPENQRYATGSGKTIQELLISNIDRVPTVPRILSQAGLSQLSRRQMVGRKLPAWRLYPRNDSRLSRERRPPRR